MNPLFDDVESSTKPAREAITATLKEHLEAVWRSEKRDVKRKSINPHDDLYESGALDSLSASQFLMLAERQYGIKLPDWLLGGRANSLAALAEYIENELAGRRS